MFYKKSSEGTGGTHAKPTPKVESTRTKKRSLIQLAVTYALCMAALVILGIPGRANAQIEHVFYIASMDQHVQELYYYNGWFGNNLGPTMNGHAAAANSTLTSFYDPVHFVEHVFYVSDDRDVRELRYQNGWSLKDGGTGMGNTKAAGPLTSFYDKSSSIDQHVFYLTQSPIGVHHLFTEANFAWKGEDLSGVLVNQCNFPAVGFPKEPSLTSFVAPPNSGMPRWNVFFVDRFSSNVCWLYNTSGKIGVANWQLKTVASQATGGWLTSFFDGSTACNVCTGRVFYVNDNVGFGDVHMLYNTGGTNWTDQDVTTQAVGAVPASKLDLTGFFAPENPPELYVFYQAYPDGDVHALIYQDGWQDQDLSLKTERPHPKTVALTSYYATGSVAPLHVFYINPNNHVGEAYWYNQWWGNDLWSAMDGFYPAEGNGGVLTSFWQP